MKKKLIQEGLTLIFRLVLALGTVFLIYNQDKLTAILLAIILLSQPIITLFSLRDVYKLSKEVKFTTFSEYYLKLSMGLNLLFIILYILAVTYFKMNTLAITIAILCLVYAYVCEQRSYIIHDFNFLMYNHKIVEISKIQSIQKKETEIKITNFDNSSKILKLRNSKEVELVERILRRK